MEPGAGQLIILGFDISESPTLNKKRRFDTGDDEQEHLDEI
jgi:hypothetical protein